MGNLRVHTPLPVYLKFRNAKFKSNAGFEIPGERRKAMKRLKVIHSDALKFPNTDHQSPSRNVFLLVGSEQLFQLELLNVEFLKVLVLLN